MPEDQAPSQKSNLFDAFKAFLGNTFEEAKLAFYFTVAASFCALVACHALGEIGCLTGLLSGMWSGFAVLIGKIGWGRNG